MKSFEYAAPSTVPQATALLEAPWGKTEVLAGGTDLVTCLKQHLTSPTRVVSLKNIAALKGIKAQGDSVRIGATTTLAELAAHPAVRQFFPALVASVEGVGSPQIMSVGTVGGDLCQRPRCWYFRNGFGLQAKDGDAPLVREGENRYHAIFGTDGPSLFVSPSSLAPALLALGAIIHIEGPAGKERHLPISDFFKVPANDSERETVLQPVEILTAIEVPVRGMKNAVYEVRHRHGLDWPYVTAAVAFQVQAGTVSNARVVLGHVAPVPWPAAKAAEALNGAKIDETVAGKCGEAAITGAKPLSQNAYKTQLVKAAVKRAVLAAAKA